MTAVAIADPDQLAVTTIRTLCIDAVQQANSGHPGTPIASMLHLAKVKAAKFASAAIEQASTFGWARYVGDDGHVVGMDTFGASAPLKHLQTKFGFTPEAVMDATRARIAATGGRS